MEKTNKSLVAQTSFGISEQNSHSYSLEAFAYVTAFVILALGCWGMYAGIKRLAKWLNSPGECTTTSSDDTNRTPLVPTSSEPTNPSSLH